MATLSVQRNVRRAFSLKEWMKAKSEVINLWLNSKSEFYSRICEFSVTWRTVLRMNAVLLCMIVGAVAVEQQPLVALAAVACSGWIVYRLNKHHDGRGDHANI